MIPKIFILITIAVIIFFICWVISANAYTDKPDFDCPNWSANARECIMLNHIIKQNDWIICAESHIPTRYYKYEWRAIVTDDSNVNANNYSELVKICGERP